MPFLFSKVFKIVNDIKTTDELNRVISYHDVTVQFTY